MAASWFSFCCSNRTNQEVPPPTLKRRKSAAAKHKSNQLRKQVQQQMLVQETQRFKRKAAVEQWNQLRARESRLAQLNKYIQHKQKVVSEMEKTNNAGGPQTNIPRSNSSSSHSSTGSRHSVRSSSSSTFVSFSEQRDIDRNNISSAKHALESAVQCYYAGEIHQSLVLCEECVSTLPLASTPLAAQTVDEQSRVVNLIRMQAAFQKGLNLTALGQTQLAIESHLVSLHLAKCEYFDVAFKSQAMNMNELILLYNKTSQLENALAIAKEKLDLQKEHKRGDIRKTQNTIAELEFLIASTSSHK